MFIYYPSLIIQAGLLTESGGINHFTGTSCSLPLPDEVNPDKLSLALEPESAALYSQETVTIQIAGDPSAAAISCPADYMVIDIGGGTVDITAHVEVGGAIQVDNIPTGNVWGGTQVNEAFSQLLQKLLQDPGYEKFLASGNNRSKQKVWINSVVYGIFECEKLLFGKCTTKQIDVDLPKIAQFYDKELQNIDTHGVEYDDESDTLYIDKEVVERQLFGPTLDGIIKCILEAIKENKYKANMFYLVGGLGGCKYVHEKVTAAIEEAYNSKGQSCTVLVPLRPQLAVATGAVMWRKDPKKIKARRSDATYGVGITIYPFDLEKHDLHYKKYNKERKEHYCDSVFTLFLKKGEMIETSMVITSDYTPVRNLQTQAIVPIYSTSNIGIKYTEDKNGKSTVTEIGQLVIDIPNPGNLPLRERRLDITMDFSGTEIQAKAKYHVTGEEVKTVCDFLSAIDVFC